MLSAGVVCSSAKCILDDKSQIKDKQNKLKLICMAMELLKLLHKLNTKPAKSYQTIHLLLAVFFSFFNLNEVISFNCWNEKLIEFMNFYEFR